MKIHRASDIRHIPQLTDTAVTVGSYDGVHRGHRSVLDHLCATARERGLDSVLITFEPHHRIFFRRESSPFLLTSLDEKLCLLRSTCIDHVVVLPFDRSLSGMPAAEFLRDIVGERLGGRLFMVGYDHAIGRDQVRGPEAIEAVAREYGIAVGSAPPVADSDATVSSTRIRQAVTEGDMDLATKLLGDAYLLSGAVVHGDARGRQLGYPTANIELSEPYKLLPPPGVYIAKGEITDEAGCSSGQGLEAMLYIGTRPTFGEGGRVIELFFMNWDGDLYGRRLRVRVLKRLRGDMTFDSVEGLVEQIRQDEARTREHFGSSS